jgi:hypothetical protein
LNHFKNSHPDIYESHARKYAGREALMEEIVPILGCKWNDVIHLSPLDPSFIGESMKALGSPWKKKFVYIKIPVEEIEASQTVVYLNREGGVSMKDHEFLEFRPADYRELEGVPSETLEYYRKCIEAERPPLLFYKVPHILTRSPIDICGYEPCECL